MLLLLSFLMILQTNSFHFNHLVKSCNNKLCYNDDNMHRRFNYMNTLLFVSKESELKNDVVFYPNMDGYIDNKMDNSNDNDDEKLYNLFLKQISYMATKSSQITNNERNDDDNNVNSNIFNKKEIKKLEESIVELTHNVPVEIIYQNKVMFGNFIGKKENSQSVIIKLASEQEITIDIGQIIGVWDILADEVIPTTAEDWAATASEALEILGNMSPRKSNLNEFYKLISRRSNSIAIDSLDLGIYILQERKFKTWINPIISAELSGVYALSSSQRYAAALLLYNDDFHFKRKTSKLATTQEISAYYNSNDDDDDRDSNNYSIDEILTEGKINCDPHSSIFIIEGGYRCLDEGTVLFKEGNAFEEYYKDIVEGKTGNIDLTSKPFRSNSILKQIQALELYSLSSQSLSPPPTVKHILKRLGKPLTTQGAQSVLKDMKYDGSSPTFNSNRPVSSSLSQSQSTSVFSITPWSEEVIESATKLSEEIFQKRKSLAESQSIGSVGKKGPSGKMDYRNSIQHPALCVDNKRATFLDDAFSLNPETGELLVHVIDVVEHLRRYPSLQDVARDRVSSHFLPSGPLHMLPPQALDALKLSTLGPNEVLTVALSVDIDSGKLLGFRVFPSIIGPVFAIDIETADEIIDGVGTDLENKKSLRWGYPDNVINDLLQTHQLMRKVMESQPWINDHFSKSTNKEYIFNKKAGMHERILVDKTPCNRMLNGMLSLYSNATVMYCQNKNIDVPIAWENFDRSNNGIVRRFATQPLRNWISQLQQKQLRSALKLELPLSRKECAMSVTHHNTRRKQTASFQGTDNQLIAYQSFEAHCSRVTSTGALLDSITVDAVGLGKGGNVRIKGFSVNGIVNSNVDSGEIVKARVKKLIPSSKVVMLEVESQ